MARKNRNRKQRQPGKPKPVAVHIPPPSQSAKRTAPPGTAESNPHPMGLGLNLGSGSLALWRGLNLRAAVAIGALAICLAVAVSFFPATWAGFVWDDQTVTDSRPIADPSGLWQIWSEPHSIKHEGHYWPLLYTTFWLEHKLWGFDPLGYHLVNLLIHAGVTLLLWRLLVQLGVPGAWLAAAVFAVHPVHVEPVVWVIGRKDLLASLFYLGSFLAYLRFVDQLQRRYYGWALALFVLGLLSKSIGVTLPVSLLVWHWWRYGRVRGADVGRILPFFAVGLVMTGIDLWHYRLIDNITFDYSLIERTLLAARSLWFYVGKLLWPTELAVVYPRWDLDTDGQLLWGSLLAAVAVTALLGWQRQRLGRGPRAALLFFVITLLPALGFVDYSHMLFSFVADRYQYLASAALIGLVIGAAAHGARHLAGAWRRGAQVLAAAMLVALGAISWQQSGIYRDRLTFYSHIIALNPKARSAHFNLGNQYRKQGRYEEALAFYQIDYRLAQTQPYPRVRLIRNHISMGKTYDALGRHDQAEEHFVHAVKLGPRFSLALDQLAAFRLRQKQYQQALNLFETLLEVKPGNAQFYIGKGVALSELNRFEEALQQYNRALSINPSLQEARRNRAVLLKAMQGR